MRFRAVAVDYDGTLATHGVVPDDVVDALKRAKQSGRKVLLVTGREFEDLRGVFAHLDVFDRVVAENGAVVYEPGGSEPRVLVDPPPPEFASALRARGVDPVHVGRVVVATYEPHETTVIDVIREIGLELHVAFNKGAVMVLPTGINKSLGLKEALEDLRLSAHNVVGIGDAENDHAFLDACECAVAVANALPAIKDRADLVTSGAHGAGVIELIDKLLEDDLASLEPQLERHHFVFGKRVGEAKHVLLPPIGTGLLVAGSEKAGKSSLVLGLVERIQEHGYQFCLIDPEGDYERLPGTVSLGDPQHAPSAQSVIDVLEEPGENVVVSLLAVGGLDRPGYFAELRKALEGLRERTGRPHWLIVDEAHHVLPSEPDTSSEDVPTGLGGLALVTLDPRRIARALFPHLNVVCGVGEAAGDVVAAAAELMDEPQPRMRMTSVDRGEALVWRRGKKRAHLVRLEPARTKRRRHRRKYAEGELSPDLSFYFRGPNRALDLRAQNLQIFVQIAAGVDEATWLHHLRAGDYSQWVREVLKDRKLARQISSVEQNDSLSGDQSRLEIKQLIEERYAPPA
jgi:hydroxymethylpyrimidine pyrophosphatase-like HAD family hydrolase